RPRQSISVIASAVAVTVSGPSGLSMQVQSNSGLSAMGLVAPALDLEPSATMVTHPLIDITADPSGVSAYDAVIRRPGACPGARPDTRDGADRLSRRRQDHAS